jgi:hypothetical protein
MKNFLKLILLVILAVTCFYAGTAFKEGKISRPDQASSTVQIPEPPAKEIISGKVKKIFEQKYLLQENGTANEIPVLINSGTRFFNTKSEQSEQSAILKGYLIEVKGNYSGADFLADEIKIISTVGFNEYRNEAMNIAFSYQADWKPSGYSEEIGGRQIWYAGKDGFFELSAIVSNGVDLEGLAQTEAKKKPYGQNPEISGMTIDGQPAKFIKAVEARYYNAALIVKYPYAVELKFDGKKIALYDYLIIYSNINYLDQLSTSVKFINKVNPQEAGNEITILAPKAGSIIKSPLTIDGEAAGSWYFEGIFNVALLDGENHKIASGRAESIGEWMSDKPVPFNLKLEFSAPTTTSGKLIFSNANPSGLPANDKKFEIPVKFEPQKKITPTATKTSSPAASNSTLEMCYVTGCSHQLCSDQKVESTCEFIEQYSCLKYAICERQPNAKCGWTITKQYNDCLNQAKSSTSTK